MARANKPHYHVRIRSRTNAFMWYAWRRGFHTRQAAQKYAAERIERERFGVVACEREACAPKLD